MFRRYPHADVYRMRTARSTPGTIDVRGGTRGQRGVINLFGQVYPGKPRHGNDTAGARETYFAQGLHRIAELAGVGSLAFPWLIGCGLAGGEWAAYRRMVDRFADTHPDILVTFYRHR